MDADQYDTLKPQAGVWTLTAPDGRTWKAESPLKCCSLEMRERVPEEVRLARIMHELDNPEASAQSPGAAHE